MIGKIIIYHKIFLNNYKMEINLVDFVENIYELVTFDTFIKFAILYFFIIWISILLWVIKDISNRTDNLFLQIISVLIILFFTLF